MTVRERLIAFLRGHPAATPDALRAAGFVLGDCLSGKYRRTYPIAAAEAVLKIPRPYRAKPGDPPWLDPIRHAGVEIETVARIRADPYLRHLRKYTAEILWSHRATGLILAQAYAPRARGPLYRREHALLEDVFRESLGKHTADYGKNMRRSSEGYPIVIDLGY